MVKDDLTRKLVLMVLVINIEKPNSSRGKNAHEDLKSTCHPKKILGTRPHTDSRTTAKLNDKQSG